MAADDELEKAGERVDTRSNALMEEFQSHYEELACRYPEHKGKRDEVFQGWAIQKIAGLQLAIDEIVHRFNALLEGMREPTDN